MPNLEIGIINHQIGKKLFSFPRGNLGLSKSSFEGNVSVAVKPQYIDKLPKIFDGKVNELLSRVDDREELETLSSIVGISNILERNLKDLSGGELQRVALCATLLKEAEVYFFDEPSSYLDIYERLRMVSIIQNLQIEEKEF